MTDARMKSFFDKMVRAGVVRPYRFQAAYTLQFVDKGVGVESAAEMNAPMADRKPLRSLRDVGKRSSAARSMQRRDRVGAARPRRERRIRVAARAVGLRQVDRAAPDRRIERADLASPKWQAPSSAGRDMGFVFQEPTLMPWTSVRENVRLPLKLARCPDKPIRNAAREALNEAVGLAEFADAYPRELSGGMKMRVSLARALVTDPDMLLMDEPFAALDEITRFKLNNDLLDRCGDAAPTVIFVTHSVFESVYLSQRIVVMTPRPGRVFTEIAIPAAYPRDERFRTSSEYAGFCRTVSEALSQAMAGGVS
jgi:NitT/TauT family transport system ATP-binding protein